MRYGRFFRVALTLTLTLTLTVAVLNGCSVVQLLPSSSCTYVRYERLNDEVEVEALCQV